MLRKKRGALGVGYNFIFSVVLLLLVGSAFGGFIISFKNNTTYERKYISRELAVLVHAVDASPGDVEYYFPGKARADLVIKKEGAIAGTAGAAAVGGIAASGGIGAAIGGILDPGRVNLQNYDIVFDADQVKVSDAGLKPEQRNFVTYFVYWPYENVPKMDKVLEQPQIVTMKQEIVAFELGKDVEDKTK